MDRRTNARTAFTSKKSQKLTRVIYGHRHTVHHTA